MAVRNGGGPGLLQAAGLSPPARGRALAEAVSVSGSEADEVHPGHGRGDLGHRQGDHRQQHRHHPQVLRAACHLHQDRPLHQH